MNFRELYDNNRKSVERALTAMWCGEASNESQVAYIRQMKDVIGELFAPKNAVPVVQCMNSYKSVYSVSDEAAKAVVGTLWKAKFSPYEHQYQSWNTLLNEQSTDGKPMSICVTTGTGSGKTECFMMPLVYDLMNLNQNGQIQALFLYPLNALMEDQKERLEAMLEGTNLTYTVYNGDLPELEPKPDDTSNDAERLRRRIDQIRGAYLDSEGNKHYKYKKMLYTRQQVRKNPPNILLTNPTMLEYILLRGTDATLINPAAKSLRWITIDETHTYTGAGAAELAMLLRRVLLAFNVDATDVRFATSSATFGNGTEEEKKLQEFISGITGTTEKQVRVIGGSRIGEEFIPSGEDEERWKQIFHADYIELDRLFPEPANISEKLQLLDDMCKREDERTLAEGKKAPDMKVKVHFFYRVPNNGLFVRLTEHQDGSFKIYSHNLTDTERTDAQASVAPLLELSRCKHCGEYVALALVNTDDWTYEPLTADDSDMFDLEEDEDGNSKTKYAIFGLSRSNNTRGDNNVKFRVSPEGKLMPIMPGMADNENEWHIVANTQCCCPYCNTKQTRKRDTEREIEGDVSGNMEDSRLQKFRLSAEFISRMMAPSILDQLEKGTSAKNEIVLHDGQQYISFVDSRQAAAKATLSQNLEQERLWFYSTVYHELCRRKATQAETEGKIKELSSRLHRLDEDSDEYEELFLERKRLRRSLCNYMTWKEISDLIKNDLYCPVFCQQFVKRSGDSEELDDQGLIKKSVIEQYVQSIMVMYLSHRPSSAAAPETMGLFTTCYPQVKDLKMPEAVETFNSIIKSPANRITVEDWQDLIQVYLDYTVRNNQSLFLKLSDSNPIDIFSSVRFATEKPRRRPFNKPKLERGKTSSARIVRYLCALIARDDSSISINQAQQVYFDQISAVIDALWDTMTGERNNLLELGTKWSEEDHAHILEKDRAYRLNLTRVCFKLYEDVYLCDTTSDNEERHTICLRPIENNFKRFSPYLAGTKPVELDENLHEKWEAYPWPKALGKNPSKAEIDEWAKGHRSLLWNNRIWGEDGVFSDRLEDIHTFPNLFVQSEHTAQVDKEVARGLQASFKDHTINILACSTTMEMGVDLGNLEVVMLSSVPPMPANYKQRAGRSGRNNKVRSACITLCGSDAIGLRTLYNPIEKMINRPMHIPTVDLMSPQVIQRHVNSFLIREYGVFTDGSKGGSLNQKVVDYYTPFQIRNSSGRLEIIDINNNPMSPSAKLGEQENTMYERFNSKCSEPITSDLRKSLTTLLHDTVFDGQLEFVIGQAQKANERCYSELDLKLGDYAFAYAQSGISDKFRMKLMMQYMEVLNNRLLTFWATSRFTPNANMPVNVLTLDLNTTGKKDFFTPQTSSNPSYSLREAIAQYAPGNNVVVDGVVYTVRGIDFTNMYQGVRSFKQIYRNSDKCVVNDSTALTGMLRWNVNEKEALDLIQPVGFLPDMNEDKSRIMDTNTFTRVSAQLIDTDDWTNQVTEPHLFSVRSNRETGEAKILYYNEGKGYGYCFCPRCGRMVLEDEVAEENSTKYPADFNTVHAVRREGQPDRPNFHYAISGKDLRKRCSGSNDREVIKRNVIIGDLIQTDYSEIRIRHKGWNKWMSERNSEENLLFTLGIVFSQTLVETLGKERGAVDFAIMPNGHLCIFDTNPGGAGYANQLSSIQIMKDVIDASEVLLKEAKEKKSKDMLLDKFTLRFAKYLDLDAALKWIEEEREASGVLPQAVAQVYPQATETSILNLKRAFAQSLHESVIFAADDFRAWDYNGAENGWRGHLLSHFVTRGSQTTFCLAKGDSTIISEPILSMIRDVKAWTKAAVHITNTNATIDLYPLAYIDGSLYFTNSREHAMLNDKWGNGTMFCVRTDNPANAANSIDLTYKPTTRLLKIEGYNYQTVTSKKLGSIIQQESNGLIEQFINYAKGCDDKLVISYQDEHLKSVLAIVLALQTIEHFIKQTDKAYSLQFLIEKYEESTAKDNVSSNLPNYTKRDEYLEGLTRKWMSELSEETHGVNDGQLIPVKSLERRTLTHWRVLSIKCGEKELCIYPDGGFLNGWKITNQTGVNRKFYTNDTTDTSDNITLARTQDIKFDVTIEDC